MGRHPQELLFLILESISIEDSVNFFSTCRGFMKLGLSFLEVFALYVLLDSLL